MHKGRGFVVIGEQRDVALVVSRALRSSGYTITRNDAGGLAARRGSPLATLLFGSLAGPAFEIRFTVDLVRGDAYAVHVHLGAASTADALKGGLLGLRRTQSALREVARAVEESLSDHFASCRSTTRAIAG